MLAAAGWTEMLRSAAALIDRREEEVKTAVGRSVDVGRMCGALVAQRLQLVVT